MSRYRLYLGCSLVVGSLFSLSLAAYLFREPLNTWLWENLRGVAAAAAGLTAAGLAGVVGILVEGWLTRRDEDRRLWRRGLGRERPRPAGRVWLDPFDWLTRRFFRTRPGRWLAADWRDGIPFPVPPYFYLFLLAITFTLFFFVGTSATAGSPVSPLLSTLIGAIAPAGLLRLTWQRRKTRRPMPITIGCAICRSKRQRKR